MRRSMVRPTRGVVGLMLVGIGLTGCGAIVPGVGSGAVDRTAERGVTAGGRGDVADGRGPTPRTLTAAEVEANAKVRLPPGTVLLSTSFVSFQDWHLTAMFRMPATALPGFLADSGFPRPRPGLRAVGDGDHASGDTWRPDAAVDVVGVEQLTEPTQGVFRKLLVDLDRPDDVTVYLVAFTT
ncbi:hypothetical protein O7632_25105 [Solwaraspora sp. WMMD406]|uniref:hypothetical protein n=1 Tax=Solwaraspora sp. WMMD406 TaxID=3016095 RepID=UPI0024163B3B|nr:hypothetical protein [Solwaraspora sp. WMMD406]MDG4767344.1 hypothetical protein [Solwaraspora sp. WMMD406]